MMEFITDNYIIIIIVAGFLIFALIGFIVDTTKNKKLKETVIEETKQNEREDIAIVNIDTLGPSEAKIEEVVKESTEEPKEKVLPEEIKDNK